MPRRIWQRSGSLFEAAVEDVDQLREFQNNQASGKLPGYFTYDALRFAAGALFRATSQITSEIDTSDVLECINSIKTTDNKAVVDNATASNSSWISSRRNSTAPSKTAGRRTSSFSVVETSLERTPATSSSSLESETEELLLAPLLPTLTLDEVSMHENWMVIYDKVYDLTKFFYEHPGGSEVLMENGGRDASFQFLSVGHSDDALKMLEDYLIGILPEEDRMWSNHGSLATSIR